MPLLAFRLMPWRKVNALIDIIRNRREEWKNAEQILSPKSGPKSGWNLARNLTLDLALNLAGIWSGQC
jgi:hypothetical protein